MLLYFFKLTLKKIKRILYNILQNRLMDVKDIIPKSIFDIDVTVATVYITLIIPLIVALIYAF